MKKALLLLLFLLLTVSAATAGDLADVRDAGVLRFGVSADGAPFIYYDQNDELIGIDISLMEAIAEKMGVKADIYEMSGESLADALTVGQIDVAGGAFSQTAARAETLDFTSVYYTTGAVFVSRSSLQLTEPLSSASFSGLKIGTRKGSGFEEWLREEFADGETVAARDIYTYSGIEDAVKALNKGRIDLVLMDANVFGSRYQSDPSLRGWQYGSAEDNYAFAVRKGSDLKAELNTHLTAMLRDGTAQEIADRFFVDQQQEEEITLQWPGTSAAAAPEATELPVSVVFPTVIPTATATPAPDKCTSYSMAYVADLTIPDGTQISAGSSFTKIWRIKNTGSCDWTTDFSLVFASGNAMGGRDIRLPKTVRPGETVDLSVDMTAPNNPGNYQGDWQLKSASNYGIGPSIWVKITVPGVSYTAPTAAPYTYYYVTPTPDYGPVQQSVKPVILWFYPNFYSQASGQCVNVYWGLSSFSTAELFVDGKAVYYGGDEKVLKQICGDVSTVGDHTIEICAYAAGGTVCDSFVYTTTP